MEATRPTTHRSSLFSRLASDWANREELLGGAGHTVQEPDAGPYRAPGNRADHRPSSGSTMGVGATGAADRD